MLSSTQVQVEKLKQILINSHLFLQNMIIDFAPFENKSVCHYVESSVIQENKILKGKVYRGSEWQSASIVAPKQACKNT